MARARDFYDWATLGAALVGIVLVTVGTWIAASEARTSREQLVTMHKQDQAWIKNSVTLTAHFDQWRTELDYELALENVGGRPAVDVLTVISVVGWWKPIPTCGAPGVNKWTVYQGDSAISIGPNEVIVRSYSKEVNSSSKTGQGDAFTLQTCTLFRDFESREKTLLQTRYSFYLPPEWELSKDENKPTPLELRRTSQFVSLVR